MAQLEPRRCGVLLALLASLLLSGAEAADEERGVHGEGPGGCPGVVEGREAEGGAVGQGGAKLGNEEGRSEVWSRRIRARGGSLGRLGVL